MAMFGIGPMEMIILALIIGLFITVPVAIVVAIAYASRRRSD